jgi:hypothetical protein
MRRVALALAILLSLIGLTWQVPVSAHSQLRQSGHLYYLDIGDSSTDQFIASGFGPNQSRNFNFCTISGRNDGSYRYQRMGHNNVIKLPVQTNKDVHLTICVEHGLAQDAWTLYANGHQLTHSTTKQSGLPIVYRLQVDAKYVTTNILRLNFRNTSDDRDGAAVFGILFWQ